MAEPKPSASTSHNTYSRKPRNHVHYHPLTHHLPFAHYCYYSTPDTSESVQCSNGVNQGAPAKFYFGPGFEPQIDPSVYGAGPSRIGQGNEHVVLFHVNPGVVISLQVGNHMEVLTGEFQSSFFFPTILLLVIYLYLSNSLIYCYYYYC